MGTSAANLIPKRHTCFQNYFVKQTVLEGAAFVGLLGRAFRRECHD
jgi:hypothetical protein